MKKFFALVLALVFAFPVLAQQDKPLRIFIRAGTKTHGPGQHDHPRFLKEWTELLNQRGAKTTGKIGFPTAAELDETDVLVFYSEEAGAVKPDDRANLDKFLKRGGGIVAIHDSVCGTDADWFKTIIGGAWQHGKAKWLEGEVGLYFQDTEHPITKGFSNFDFKDEIYYELNMMPEARVLASSFHTPFIIAPQLWTYEKDNYRSFVCVPGHEYTSFNLPHFRALLLRGIAWAGKRTNVDLLCSKEELASVTYPEGGPTAPEKAAAKLNTHPDFNISLVAAEPLIEKAISVDFDEKGRVWVAETPEYPGGRSINKNDEPIADWARRGESAAGGSSGRKPKDRISWLEDTDGDGRMDKRHVFADGLELVTSVVFYKDGVIVAQAPDILWLRDTNGDGKCDMQGERVVLYTGFGTMDTHAVINNFRRGMDGWIYGAVGYSAGAPRSASGQDLGRVTAGILRFKPDGSAVEQVASGSCNTWGFDFAPDNEMFYTTATCGEHFLHIVMPEKAVARASVQGLRSSSVVPDHQNVFPSVHHTRPAYVQIDWVGQFTASSGACIYNGGAWPERYNNSSFSSEPTVSLVHQDVFRPSGATFVAGKESGQEQVEFVAGSDLWFRPVHTRIGPDGALYVVDFYNQAAIHNDTRGPKHGARNAAVRPDRDHHFGRIWRVQHKQAKTLPAANIATGNHKDWVAGLNHPNGVVRNNAHRLLMDNNATDTVADLQQVVQKGSGYARIHALWLLNSFGKLDAATMNAAFDSADPGLRKNALRLVAETASPVGASEKTAIFKALDDSDARVKMNALLALAALPAGDDVAGALAIAYPKLQDKYLEAAALGVASKDPLAFIRAAFRASDPATLGGFVPAVARLLANKQDAAAAGELVVLLSKQPNNLDGLKRMTLEALAAALKPDLIPAWNNDLQAAFAALLKSPDRRMTSAVLPIAARWDKDSTLKAELQPLIEPLIARLNNTSVNEDERGQLLANLVGVRRLDASILPAIGKILTQPTAPRLQRRALEALGTIPDREAGKILIDQFPRMPFELREPAVTQIVRRADWSEAFLDAIREKKIDLNTLGPVAIHRLRTHPEKAIAERASTVIDDIRGPEQKEKNALVAQFLPSVQESGDLANGKKLYTQNCATCHKFKGEGRDLAPDLTGMGAHGPADLLVHIVDPNRVVEPNFLSVNIETKDDQSLDGIVARENNTLVVLRNATADVEIRQDNIKSRRASGLSLMPNGFEALGKDGLRDLIGYLCADEKRFRILDLRPVFTADSTRGIFNSLESTNESLRFRNFGVLKVGEVPFDVINPVVSTTGKNLLVLKGGAGYSKTLAQKVEVKADNVKANVLHFLGGVAGWGFPCCGENKNEGTPVVKATVHFVGGGSEELTFKNGVEFADYIGKYDVPGSREVNDVLRAGQLRWFSRALKTNGAIEKITLESFDHQVAPVIVAITAEQSDHPEKVAGSTAAAAPVASKITARTLIVGGGSSHNFDRWFNKEDKSTLAKAFVDVAYTDQPNIIGDVVEKLDVLYLSNNQPIADKGVRAGIMNRANTGKGLLLVHPALWYNWADWPEYNRQLVGGGARSHENFAEFEVTVINRDHPITKGLPEKFLITDELYRFQKDTAGPAIDVLAIGKSKSTGASYPVLWTTKLPNSRIVCITLGHDEKAHALPEFQTLLLNAHAWAKGDVK